MKKSRFRNHFSIVCEKLGLIFLSFVFLIFTEGIELIEDLINGGSNLKDVVIISVILGLIFIIAFIWQARIWALTWISIDDDIITIERKTLMSKKNSIGIKNISNVNTEQNLFEMLIGTCKVKLDTNSLSTANETDVQIVLKKTEAEQLRKQLLQRINELNAGEVKEEVVDDLQEYDIVTEYKEIFMNGIYSLNFTTILIFIGSMIGMVELVKEGIRSGDILYSLLSGIGGIATLFVLIFTCLSSIIKGFIQMYGFRATREKDKIYLNYGLFRKVNYTIPVDKINGIVVKQTLIARIFRRYSVELINVGMGDNEKAAVSFIFYTKREKVDEIMAKLLPEFEDIMEWKMERQPRRAWIVKLIGLFVFAVVLLIGNWIVYTVTSNAMIHKCCVITSFAIYGITLVVKILSYFATGICIKEHFVGIMRGTFGKYYVFMKYGKMQYIAFRENVITKRLGICKGMVTLLAAMQFQNQNLPYMKKEYMEVMERGLLRKSEM